MVVGPLHSGLHPPARRRTADRRGAAGTTPEADSMRKRVVGLLSLLIACLIALAFTRPELRTFSAASDGVPTAVLARQHARLLMAESIVRECTAKLDFAVSPAPRVFRAESRAREIALSQKLIALRGLGAEVRVGPERRDWNSGEDIARLATACETVAVAARGAWKTANEDPPPSATWWRPEWRALQASLGPLADAADALQRSCAMRNAALVEARR